MPVDKELLDILACPESKAPLVPHEDEKGEWLVSTDAETRRRYPVRDGIPIMLVDESEQLEPEAWKAIVEGGGA
jgi:uncharacterized protein YbaR (Trm112 family)